MPLLVAQLRILLKQGRSEVINLHPMAEESNLHRELLLSAIGLRGVMIERNYIDPFDKDLFHRYTSKEYLHSPHKEMDEVYRMCEVVLLHKAHQCQNKSKQRFKLMQHQKRFGLSLIF